MLDSFSINLLISSILGFLAGLGCGGGSLLILWLTLVVQVDHTEARILNLIFFLPAAVITSLFRWKQGIISIKEISPGIIAGIIAAFIFSNITSKINIVPMRKLFGVLLIIIGVKELKYKITDKKTDRK